MVPHQSIANYDVYYVMKYYKAHHRNRGCTTTHVRPYITKDRGSRTTVCQWDFGTNFEKEISTAVVKFVFCLKK